MISTSARFLLEIFLWRLVLIKSICYAVLPTHIRLMHHPRMSAPMKYVSTLCPLSLLCKKVQEVSFSYTQNKAQLDHHYFSSDEGFSIHIQLQCGYQE